MVGSLGLGKFYGSSLPRPRFYTDVKFNGERIDPPLPVMDALLEWAEEAHWSMGGSCTTRRRYQGRIEGDVNRLRVQRDEMLFKKSAKQQPSVVALPDQRVIKRRRVVRFSDEDEEEEEKEKEQEQEQGGLKREAAKARKLREGFEKVAGKNEDQPGKVNDEVAVKQEVESIKVKNILVKGRRGVAGRLK